MLTPNLFAVAFGVAGLAGCWRLAGGLRLVPGTVADALFVLAGAVWLVLAVGYPRQVARRPGGWRAELRHPVLGPFLSLAPITGLLVTAGLRPYAPRAAPWLFALFAVVTLLLGASLTGQWIVDRLEVDTFHPGYFLPTVAGGLLVAQGAAELGHPGAARAAFGIGLVGWALLGSPILARMFFRPALPAVLLPVLAIEAAPPAVAANAYLAVTGGRVNTLTWVLWGYTALMALVQVRLVGLYRRAPFGPAWWSFTFPYAAVATAGLHWLDSSRPAGYRAWGGLLLAAITVLVGAIAVWTVAGLARGGFLATEAPPAPPTAPPHGGPPAGPPS
ncbi:dicarboxylate transporter/tellurite-resistance protein TehA [Kitasatospora nipponensis]|uniref:Dicarboxylate transporter/tellurite-resistance protein TehA n=1 Tax=Kitasatospora nipponensis TaxID=258049 RepID=A0ABN1WDB2_9ACTN